MALPPNAVSRPSQSVNAPPASLFVRDLSANTRPLLYDSRWDYSGAPNRFVNLIQAPIHMSDGEEVVLNYIDSGPPSTVFYAYTLVPD